MKIVLPFAKGDSADRRSDQSGMTLVEMVIVLAIIGLVLGAVFQLLGNISQQVTDQAAARQLQEVQRAAQDYISGNYDEALYYASCASTATYPATCTGTVATGTVRQLNAGTSTAPTDTTAASSIQMLIAKGYLPTTFDGTNPFGQKYVVFTKYIRTTSGTAVTEQMELYTTAVDLTNTPGDPTITDIRGGRIATMLGADGGFVQNNATTAIGSFGGWSQTANALNASGVSVGPGNVVAMNHFNGGSLISSYLHRYPVPGFLQANRMFTAMTFDAATTAVAGSSGGTEASQVAATTAYDSLTDAAAATEMSPPAIPQLRTKCRANELYAFSLCDVGNVRFADDASAVGNRRGVDGHDLDMNWNRVLNADNTQGALFTALDYTTSTATAGTTVGTKLTTWGVNDDTATGFWAINAPIVALGQASSTAPRVPDTSVFGAIAAGQVHTTTLVAEDWGGVLGKNLYAMSGGLGNAGFYVNAGGIVAAGTGNTGGMLAGACTPLVSNRIIACNGIRAQGGDVTAASGNVIAENGGVAAGSCVTPSAGQVVACNGLLVNAGGATINGGMTVSGNATFNNDVTIRGRLIIGTCEVITSTGSVHACGDVTATTNMTAQGNITANGNMTAGLTLTVGQTILANGQIKSNSEMRAPAFYYDSDIRLKHDVVPVKGALDKLLTLKGVEWRWNDSDKLAMGVIAQDVEKVFPELVSEGSTGTKGVAYNGLMGPMIEAMRQLKAENDDLKTEVESLRAAR